jgi:7-cyano-7-deazaguanine synthase
MTTNKQQQLPLVYVLLSGGLDSTTVLGMACEEFGNHNVIPVSVKYGQRHKERELAAAREVARNYGVHLAHYMIDLSTIIGKGGLTDDEQQIPAVSYDQLSGVSPTYVPFRNGLMLAALTSLAASDPNRESLVAFGAHAEDAHNWAYPDCTPEFIGAMANAIYVGSYHKIRVWAPLMHMKKSEIVLTGVSIGVPYELTWSCYEGGEKHCGVCPTCRARKDAFTQAGFEDPTEYAQ